MNEKQIFIVSYPRSGSTWLRYLLTSLIHPEEELTVDNVDRLAPDIHEMHRWEELGVKYPAVIKSHCIKHNKYDAANIVYLYRDFRDVAVSYFLFTEAFKVMSFPEFLEKFIHDGMQFGEWHKHVYYWMYESKGFYFIPLKYENLCLDTYGFLSQIVNFLGLLFRDKDKEIRRAVERCTFSKMSYIAERDGLEKKFLGFSGKPGAWREYFSKEDLDYLWMFYGNILEKLGYRKEL